ncbi:hypothetical protein AMIS_12540 [Actinoplanes missouriensis 431]|uniref:Uncharacterized protein n=1 Tax=Actinoplanes missouriensis (strain ATCC 14538 / DSM 43046 / CBS 188.64 / JCM 3121 / NBRC 102363 / NCIMB 12654 / NRRL B-3342 / UNCC 431) TaxID=512565 RepID=I0H0D7_ACTM4|nr:hypothetical protein [Actinoplanes missouriensis]BAL86474.1 hypothetical protein AMIS_12540 [Actinoplanes missouriensis 431]
MPASIGIWAEQTLPSGVLYRWEADHGSGGSGFVRFEPDSQRFRPADRAGNVLGDLTVDGVSGDTTGSADGVDRTVFTQVSVSILRRYTRSGEPPKTAHAHYY